MQKTNIEHVKKHRVLVVDDDDILCTLLKRMLNSNNCDVFMSKNGKEAIEVIKSYHLDLIVSDLNMPVMDGRELLCYIKTHYNKLKVIIMSSSFDNQYLFSRGALALLGKPFRRHDFIEKVNYSLSEKRRTRRYKCNALLCNICYGNKKYQGVVVNICLEGCYLVTEKSFLDSKKISIGFKNAERHYCPDMIAGKIVRNKNKDDSGCYGLAIRFNGSQITKLLDNARMHLELMDEKIS